MIEQPPLVPDFRDVMDVLHFSIDADNGIPDSFSPDDLDFGTETKQVEKFCREMTHRLSFLSEVNTGSVANDTEWLSIAIHEDVMIDTSGKFLVDGLIEQGRTNLLRVTASLDVDTESLTKSFEPREILQV